jgi:hypothetical protein
MKFLPRRKPDIADPVPPIHPLMQAHVDMTSRYIVATDHAIWGGFSNLAHAIRLAEAIAGFSPVHERIAVSTTEGHAIWTLTGEDWSGIAGFVTR